jgi:hypothetical protein
MSRITCLSASNTIAYFLISTIILTQKAQSKLRIAEQVQTEVKAPRSSGEDVQFMEHLVVPVSTQKQQELKASTACGMGVLLSGVTFLTYACFMHASKRISCGHVTVLGVANLAVEAKYAPSMRQLFAV